jgi:transcription elongation factor GreA
MHEEKHADRDDYVPVDIDDLPRHHKACQFECCFQGLPDAAAVAATHGQRRAAERAQRIAKRPRPSGISVGQRVTCRDLGSGETKQWAIVGERRADSSQCEISPESPVARALIGSQVGETVDIELPRGSRQIQILAVHD